MTKNEKIDTKEKLLLSGLKIFAEHGYSGAIFKDICDEASVNIASINYHFKDKESFYAAVRDYAIKKIRYDMEECWQVMEDNPWEGLKLHIRVLLKLTFDETLLQVHWFFMRELIDLPNVPLSNTAPEHEQQLELYNKRMSKMLASLLGEASTPQNMNFLRYTYHSLCQFLPIHKQIEEKRLKGKGAFNVALSDKNVLEEFILNTVKNTVNYLKNNDQNKDIQC